MIFGKRASIFVRWFLGKDERANFAAAPAVGLPASRQALDSV